jgi:hypothetical protein
MHSINGGLPELKPHIATVILLIYLRRRHFVIPCRRAHPSCRIRPFHIPRITR